MNFPVRDPLAIRDGKFSQTNSANYRNRKNFEFINFTATGRFNTFRLNDENRIPKEYWKNYAGIRNHRISDIKTKLL